MNETCQFCGEEVPPPFAIYRAGIGVGHVVCMNTEIWRRRPPRWWHRRARQSRNAEVT